MRPWISGASFQDDFAGLPELVTSVTQHSAGKNMLDSVQPGDLPGVGMTIIDGIVRTQRSRNTPPATKVPEIVGH